MTAEWVPRSGFDRVGGYVWLPRLLDKVRRAREHPEGDYFALEQSPLDQAALSLWRVSGDRMRAWVDEGLSDEAIAGRLAERVNPAACSRTFLLMWAPAMVVLDADDGRLHGPASALRAFVPVFLGIRQVLVALGITRQAS